METAQGWESVGELIKARRGYMKLTQPELEALSELPAPEGEDIVIEQGG